MLISKEMLLSLSITQLAFELFMVVNENKWCLQRLGNLVIRNNLMCFKIGQLSTL